MNESLNELDRQLISAIDLQVALLHERGANDLTIINTLMDFTPDVKCLINSDNDKLLELQCHANQHFAYFVELYQSL